MSPRTTEDWQVDREAFHAERKTIIGGSDAAAIMGLSRWKTPLDVWVDKVMDEPPREMGMRQFIGMRLEPLLAEMAGAALGRTFRRRTGLLRSKDYPFIGGHVDFHGLEVKTSYSAEGWGPDGATVEPGVRDSWDVIPIDYLLQVQHYLYVTGWSTMFVAVLIGHDDFRTYTVPPVPALIDPMVAAEVEFWHEFVEPGVAPPMDASEGAKAYLRAKFPRATGVLRAATPEETLLIERVREAKAAAASADKEAEALANTLKDRIGSDIGLAAPGVNVTYSNVSRQPAVNWEGVARAYRRTIETRDADVFSLSGDALIRFLDTVEGLHTETPESYRTLRLTYSRREP